MVREVSGDDVRIGEKNVADGLWGKNGIFIYLQTFLDIYFIIYISKHSQINTIT